MKKEKISRKSKYKKLTRGLRMYDIYTDDIINELTWRNYKEYEIDYIEHIKTFIKNNVETIGRNKFVPKIHIGCDSQRRGKKIVYAICIGMRYVGNRGTHLIKAKFILDTKRNDSLFVRLYNEIKVVAYLGQIIERELITTGFLREELDLVKADNGTYHMPLRFDKKLKKLVLKNFVEVSIDINADVNEKSNVVYKTAVGELSGLGFNVYAKPDGIIASSAADKIN